MHRLPDSNEPMEILEVGCGTGKNIKNLAKKFSHANITGIDISGHMLTIARKKLFYLGDRITFLEEPYDAGSRAAGKEYNLVLFSYALSMINPQWKELLKQTRKDLKPGGKVAVVDFYHGTKLYRDYMAMHHVKLEGHILPTLKDLFEPMLISIRNAYLGVWKYYYFIGKK
jgi:S-adenosylmethionine-diacylgycerolhomoserine-N-methlytransferase